MPHDASAEGKLADPARTFEVPEDVSYIAATEAEARPRRTLKYGDSFVVVDSYGDIGTTAHIPDGLFHADTRHLSRFELLLYDRHPLLLGSRRAVEIGHWYFGTPSMVTLSLCSDLSTLITISAAACSGPVNINAAASAAHRINFICRCAVAIAGTNFKRTPKPNTLAQVNAAGTS